MKNISELKSSRTTNRAACSFDNRNKKSGISYSHPKRHISKEDEKKK